MRFLPPDLIFTMEIVDSLNQLITEGSNDELVSFLTTVRESNGNVANLRNHNRYTPLHVALFARFGVCMVSMDFICFKYQFSVEIWKR